MFEWICNLGTIWGMILTGVGLILGIAIGLFVIGAIVCGVMFLWDKIPYRIAHPIEVTLKVIWLTFVGLIILVVIFVAIAATYAEICDL